jgi:hypothetical protein
LNALKDSDASVAEAFEAIAELHLSWKAVFEKDQRRPINERIERLKERLANIESASRKNETEVISQPDVA